MSIFCTRREGESDQAWLDRAIEEHEARRARVCGTPKFDLEEYVANLDVPQFLRKPTAAPVVPDGFCIVPVEPTEAMLRAAWKGCVLDQSVTAHMKRNENLARQYRFMLAAAPDAKGEDKT